MIDFGMATYVTDEQPLQNQSTVIGTPKWMSYFIHDGYQPHYRDDLILELEKRIYNNIKANYANNSLDLFDIIPGKYLDPLAVENHWIPI